MELVRGLRLLISCEVMLVRLVGWWSFLVKGTLLTSMRVLFRTGLIRCTRLSTKLTLRVIWLVLTRLTVRRVRVIRSVMLGLLVRNGLKVPRVMKLLVLLTV